MDKNKRIRRELAEFQKLDDQKLSVETKLDELITLLQHARLDSESVKNIRHRFNEAAYKAERAAEENFKAFEVLDEDSSRERMLDNLEQLLGEYPLDSRTAKKAVRGEKVRKAVLLLIALILIILGFAMIVMPAPPYFEMFTIYYFSPDDGVTLMDLISLLIVFTGVYLFITSIMKVNTAD